jgi:diaminohydroxyphosphoribosylaminopyrimidine deaminase/5-amino-6-(5-phosphoribosylamino)uracil reductase
MTRPHVTLKLATSLDGRIATAAGESRWITGPEARAEVHKMRAAHDAVLVGIGTALADDPELTARTDPPPAKQPLRIVLDRKLRLPAQSRLATTVSKGGVIVISTGGWPTERSALTDAGVEIDLATPGAGEGEIAAALRVLTQLHGVRSVLVEGGGEVAASFVREGLVDRLEWFRAPLVLGASGKPALADLSYEALAEAPRWRRLALRELGSDLWESYERAR